MTTNTFPVLAGIAWPVIITPTFNTITQQAASGAEYRTGLMQSPLYSFTITLNYLSESDYTTFSSFFIGQQGALIPFYFYADPAAPYTATNYTFGTGDGTTASFVLQSPNGAVGSVIGTPSIYRTDWQGQQLLYATPRTNQFTNTVNMTGWGIAAGGSITTGQADPSGGVGAILFTCGAVAYSDLARTYMPSSVFGTTNGCYYVVKAGTARYIGIRLCGAAASSGEAYNFLDTQTGLVSNSNVPSFPIVATPLSGGWYRIEQAGAVPINDSGVNDIAVTDSAGATAVTTLNGLTAYFFSPEYESGTTTPGDYIPNATSAPLTVTDYTLSGTTVTPAPVAATGATFQWTGSGYVSQGTQYLVRFDADSLSFEQFMYQVYQTKSIKLKSVL